MQLSNPEISLAFDHDQEIWRLESPSLGISFTSLLPTIEFTRGRTNLQVRLGVGLYQETIPNRDVPLSKYKGLRFVDETNGIRLSSEWMVHPSHAIVLWRWSLENLERRAIRLHAAVDLLANQPSRSGLVDLVGSIPRTSLEFTFPGRRGDRLIYNPGWQSWSSAGWYRAGDRFPFSWLKPLTHPMIFNGGKAPPRSQGHTRAEMFAGMVDLGTHTGLCFGYVTQQNTFGFADVVFDRMGEGIVVRSQLDGVRLEPGRRFSSDWACIIAGSEGQRIVDQFASLAGEVNRARTSGQVPVGWCSWYDYGQSISEDIIEQNMKSAADLSDRVPMDLIQIDDGFQAAIGDWLSPGPTFPSGMTVIATKIKAAGFEPGLWLAPFIGLRESATIRDNPGWVIRNRLGLPVNTGFVWNQFGRALDPSHLGFLDYLREVIATATSEWGYRYLKLDFLYAGTLNGTRSNPHLTRAQAFRQALQLIRETAGEAVTLVGCGCPLGSGVGIFDTMRISPDIDTSWKPSNPPLSGVIQNEPTLPAAVNAIRNIYSRAHFHRTWWINDPDCVLVREQRSSLSLDETHSLLTAIGMSGGSLVLSDRIASLSPERLELFSTLIPPLDGRMKHASTLDPVDLPIVAMVQENVLGEWWLVACANLADHPREVDLNLAEILPITGRMHVFDVWHQRYTHLNSDRMRFSLERHETTLLAIRSRGTFPAWLGDNIHISQGKIVREWFVEDGMLVCRIDAGRLCDLRAHLYIPGDILAVTFEGKPVRWTDGQAGAIVIEISDLNQGNLEVKWENQVNDD